MTYKNPILITLNNTLHIKADNLEPVEVDSSCKSQLLTLAFNVGKHTINTFYVLKEGQGINISELSDRIEVREERILLAKSGGYKEGLMIEPATFIDGKPYKVTYKAFLLLVKEDNFPNIASALRKGINPMYTIEEIEKAIRKENDNCGQPLTDKSIDEIINNLKK